MFMRSIHHEVQDDLVIEASGNLSDIESAVRVLLQAMDRLPEQDSAEEPCRALEVFIDGQVYTVCIDAVASVGTGSRCSLSPRELDIARLISKGMATKMIAAALGLQPSTVSTYTKRIYLKLNVNSRTEMVAKMLNERLLYTSPISTRSKSN
jgi:DNA-binding NarL/FixJ family response regulator